MKQSNNPFKMWESYIGALILGGYMFNNYLERSMPGGATGYYFHPLNEGISMTFSMIVIGFLIGWGVHYLIRKYKR